ncbi:MAG: inositol monophosphatase [Clostridia bacterium]|nr:inositol monophosphatase [Clostridia bacterium]
MLDLNLIKFSVIPVIKKAGERIRTTHSSPVHEKAGHYNFVTDTDVAVQEFLRGELSKLLPDARFFAEEQENAALTDEYTWVVDPIDGTLNFMRNRHFSCVSIALLKDKTPVLGMIYNPFADELFTAVKGQGAYCNDNSIHVSSAHFEKSLSTVGTAPYNAELHEATVYCIREFLTKGGDIRRTGSAALDLTDVASGRTDTFVELILSPWDFAAGALLVTEAGGRFDMPYNENGIDFGKPAAIFASNPVTYEKALQIVKKAKELIKE